MIYNNISGMMKMPLWLQLLPSTLKITLKEAETLPWTLV